MGLAKIAVEGRKAALQGEKPVRTGALNQAYLQPEVLRAAAPRVVVVRGRFGERPPHGSPGAPPAPVKSGSKGPESRGPDAPPGDVLPR